MEVREKLIREFGKENVVISKDELGDFNTDKTGIKGNALAAVLVRNEKMVREVVLFSKREKIAITPQGARTGYSGGAVPLEGIALSFSKMNRILDVDEKNLFAVVEPGVINADLKREVEKLGLFYPPDPASLNECTIGGNVAENASGPVSYRYGSTREYVKGLKLITMEGDTLNLGGKLYKNEMGYNLIGLMVGSEGTLSLFTRIYLKLIPLPEKRYLIYSTFRSLREAANAIVSLHSSYPRPTSIEIMDRNSIKAVEAYLGEKIDADTTLYVGIDGTEEEVRRKTRSIINTLTSHGAIHIEEADEEKEEKLWKLRRELSPATKALKPDKINEDISIPVSLLPALLERIDEISKRNRTIMVTFGHAGEGNLHVNIMFDGKNPDEKKRAELSLTELMETVKKFGGSATGEHGIGISKKRFMKLFLGKEIKYMKLLKKMFDPDNLLNPGKIFP